MNRQMGGFKEMTDLPSTMFIVDPTKEKIALAEAQHMGVPVVEADGEEEGVVEPFIFIQEPEKGGKHGYLYSDD